MPLTNVTTAITAATPITTPSKVSAERSLFAHNDRNAILIASEMFMGLRFSPQFLGLRERPSPNEFSRTRRADPRWKHVQGEGVMWGISGGTPGAPRTSLIPCRKQGASRVSPTQTSPTAPAQSRSPQTRCPHGKRAASRTARTWKTVELMLYPPAEWLQPPQSEPIRAPSPHTPGRAERASRGTGSAAVLQPRAVPHP